MKIHIVGGPGSGKSFLAKKLSRELGIPTTTSMISNGSTKGATGQSET